MACFKPLTAFQGGGVVQFAEFRDSREIQLPCGQCVGCRVDRARDWTVRCVHEAQMHPQSAFVTLTYDDKNLPAYGSLHYPDFQKFLKRLRKAYGPLRFFMSGEYGERLGRPHYHALLFGFWPSDRMPDRLNVSDNPYWTSPTLDRAWGKGRANFGLVTPETAMYCASYTLKKVTGPMARDHYTRVDLETGEAHQVSPEFSRMSLKPGIGATWLDKFGPTDVYAHDVVRINGRAFRPPKFYDSKLDPGLLESLKFDRYLKFLPHLANATDDRLAVRERLLQARLNLKEKRL